MPFCVLEKGLNFQIFVFWELRVAKMVLRILVNLVLYSQEQNRQRSERLDAPAHLPATAQLVQVTPNCRETEFRVCGKSVQIQLPAASSTIYVIPKSLSESPPGILPPVVSNSIWTSLEYSVKFPFTVKVTYKHHWCNTYTKEWSSEWFLFGKESWWPHCAAAKGLSFNLWVTWWFGQWYHWESLRKLRLDTCVLPVDLEKLTGKQHSLFFW